MKRICLFLVFLVTISEAAFCLDVITMAYRPSEKAPYIEGAPSNEGLYQAVFKEAARRIGLGFEIKRYPKKRAYLYLEAGDVDFYPGASFNPFREKIGYFIDNCMVTQGVMILYREDITITSISEIKDYVLLYNMGGTTAFFDYAGVDISVNKLREVPGLGIVKAIQILQLKQGDFYAYDLKTLEIYLKKNKVDGIKKYPVSLSGQIDHLIFSKKSKYYKEKPNPDYDSRKELNVDNLPYTLHESSVAYKFQQTLKAMQKSGEIDRIFQTILEQSSYGGSVDLVR